MDIILFWIAASLYSAATACFFVCVVFSKQSWEKAAFLAGTAGLVPHLLAIIMRWSTTGHGPYITRYEVFSSNAFVAVLLYIVLTLFWKQVRGIGALIFPFAVILMGYGSLSIEVRAEAPFTFKNGWLVIHIFFAKLAVAAILISSVLSLFFLIKAKRPDALKKIATREILEDLSYRFLTLSLLFQTMMIVAGSIWAYSSWGRFWGWDPIETWSLVSWIAFGIVLHLRRLHGWKGARGAYLTMGVFLVALFAAYVVVFISPSVHSSYLVK